MAKKHNGRKFWFLTSITLSVLVITFVASLNRFRDLPMVEGESTIDSGDITVSATIGRSTNMTIYGYAPASSMVFLTGFGVNENRLADTNGYFIFGNIQTTSTSSDYPELCLTAYVNSLSTQPTCLPPLPGGSNVYEIGPVILSPIISIEQNTLIVGSQVGLNGYTIPNSTVNIYFTESGRSLAFVEKVLAYTIPVYQVVSDDFGKFQFNLPSNIIARWKVYASTTYQSSLSPKSTTLNFSVKSNISYYLKTVYETIIRVTTVVNTAASANSGDSVTNANANNLSNISVEDVYTVRSKMPYFVMLAEGLILLILLIIILIRRLKKKKVKAIQK